VTVSVILCSYNGERFIQAAVDSVLAQTSADFELIVVDDGSTDSTPSILSHIRDPRVRSITQHNQGAAAALQAGLKNACGEFIAFIDQDDVWEPDKLTRHMTAHAENPTADLTFSWFRLIDFHGRLIGAQSRRVRGCVAFADLLEDFVIAGTSNVVVRRDAIERAGGIDPSIPRLYDLDLFLRIALLKTQNIQAVPYDLMLYRRHRAQLTKDRRGLAGEWELLLEKMRTLAPSAVAERESRARSNYSRYWARLAYEEEDYGDALTLLRRGFHYAPLYFLKDPRNWLTTAAALSGAALPRAIHHRLERLAGLDLRRSPA
jgi:glycosyltransferase involved in cell wall biosynthesis